MRGSIACGICPEGANVDFSSRDSTIRVNLTISFGQKKERNNTRPTHDNGDEWILKLLVVHLRTHIDPR